KVFREMLKYIVYNAFPEAEHSTTSQTLSEKWQSIFEQKWLGRSVGTFSPIFLLYLLHVSVEKNWVNPLLLPAPELVWVALKDLYQTGELWSNLSVSLSRIAYGFSAGILDRKSGV